MNDLSFRHPGSGDYFQPECVGDGGCSERLI
jgi:hypothetical protein